MRMCERTPCGRQRSKKELSDATARRGVCPVQIFFDRVGCRTEAQDSYAVFGIV